jgi:hypothetical protein
MHEMGFYFLPEIQIIIYFSCDVPGEALMVSKCKNCWEKNSKKI